MQTSTDKTRHGMLKTVTDQAHLHRFGDAVAVHMPGAKELVYMSADEAEALADALRMYVQDVRHRAFTVSTIPSQSIGD